MKKPFIEIPAEVCQHLERSTQCEWWLANGLGGYASGTVSGILTRRYHGLFTIPLFAPLGRQQMFVKADASLLVDGEEIAMHSNQWHQGETHPCGHELIEHFYLDGNIPVWQFRVNGLLIEQRIWMKHEKNRTCVAFRLLASDKAIATATLRLGLIASDRNHHGVSHRNAFDISVEETGNCLLLHYQHGNQLYLFSDNGSFKTDATWIENFFLQAEQQRGLESNDNHLRVGELELELSHEWRGLVIGTEPLKSFNLLASMADEYQRNIHLLEDAFPGLREVSKPAWIFQLVLAADSFLIEHSVIAGYPWFGDWGRDTMIALPGLCLATNRYDTAWEILNHFSAYVDEGLLPNNFPGEGRLPEYNTVDASLWYIEAWRSWLQATNDLAAIEEVLPLLEEIIYAYHDGTRYGIAVDPQDGLLMAGEKGQQLTWMDARVEGREITPRHGKPVEINALWYNALQSIIHFCQLLDHPADEFKTMAEQCRQGFARFIRADGLGLYDVLDGPHGNDEAIRPNQIFALSLTYSALQESVMQPVIDVCRKQLLTPYGLRSLSPDDDRYVGCYEGGVAQRDGSYHQGPVWGWLLGHYAMAEYRVSGDADAAQQRLAGMEQHLFEGGLGTISEIFDGDAPHKPKGAPSQAWSVACTLEAWWRLERAKLVENQ